MHDRPAQVVIDWLNHQPRHSVWMTAITVMELHQGIEILAPGRRQTALKQALDRLTTDTIAQQIAAFDDAAAKITAVIAAERRRRGRPGELRNTMIAGIALAAGASLATRNTRHFDDLSLSVVDPWRG